jgi:2-oxoisovalerate dehydrogenase E2 component (dihydrolipoyl transacylase)
MMERFVFKLPDVGEGTAEAEIVAWHVCVGQDVTEDQHLVDVMTDKATVEMTSPVAGKIVALRGGPGDMAVVGAPLVEFEVLGAVTEEAPKPLSQDYAEPNTIAVSVPPLSKVLAAPAVRLRAADLGVDLSHVPGTGTGGRVTHGDLDDHLAQSRNAVTKAATPLSDTFVEVRLIGLRRKIAERMQEAKRRIPHFSYIEEIDMTELEAARAQLNETRGSKKKLTVLPFLITALVRTLPDFPQINAHFDDETSTLRQFKALHVGIATQTEAGLMVPVIRHAETLNLWQLAGSIAVAAERARDNKASKEELSGSTITVSSLGTLGGLAATPIINHPEVAIIGPNAIIERPMVRNGQIQIRKMMNISSSYDHRVIDGIDAARFVKRIKELLEHPALLFVSE